MLRGLTWTPRASQGLLLTSPLRAVNFARARSLLNRLPLEASPALPKLYRFKFLFKWGLRFYYNPNNLLSWLVAARIFKVTAALAQAPLSLTSTANLPLRPRLAHVSRLRQPVTFASEVSIAAPKRFTLWWWATAAADFSCYAPQRQQKLYRFSPRLAPLSAASVRLFF